MHLKFFSLYGILMQKFGKEEIFGIEIMKQCIPGGSKELPALLKNRDVHIEEDSIQTAFTSVALLSCLQKILEKQMPLSRPVEGY